MDEARFIKLAEDAWDHVPEHWKGMVENVALLIEDEPSEEVRVREHLGPHDTLLGLYHGIPHNARGSAYGTGMTLPDTITLFRLPILEDAQQLMRAEPLTEHTHERFDALVRSVIKETLWHEIGHYFGLSEGEIDEREEEGTNRFES
jgi:predicted Zn-dependent protease with MMP-like domain